MGPSREQPGRPLRPIPPPVMEATGQLPKRNLATVRINPLAEAKPPPLILLPGNCISLALENAGSDFAAM